MLTKNQLVEAQITAMSSDGNGIAKVDGMVIFVPYSAVGDKLLVRVVKVLKHYSFGIIDRILEPGEGRVQDSCPVYRRCGGCSFRHISYREELVHKAQFVEDNLRRLGGLEPQMLPITPSPKQQGYRNKAQYPIRMQDGKVTAGFFARRSHRVIDCACCDLQPEFFEQVVEYTTRFLQENNISVYDEESGKGLVRHLYLRYGETTDQLMVCLVVNGEKLPCADRYIEGLRQVCGKVCSVVLNINREQSNVILGNSCRTLWGSDTIEDSLCGVRFELSPLSFYQVNRAAAEQLYLLGSTAGRFSGRRAAGRSVLRRGYYRTDNGTSGRSAGRSGDCARCGGKRKGKCQTLRNRKRTLFVCGCKAGGCSAGTGGTASRCRGGGPTQKGMRPAGAGSNRKDVPAKAGLYLLQQRNAGKGLQTAGAAGLPPKNSGSGGPLPENHPCRMCCAAAA